MRSRSLRRPTSPARCSSPATASPRVLRGETSPRRALFWARQGPAIATVPRPAPDLPRMEAGAGVAARSWKRARQKKRMASALREHSPPLRFRSPLDVGGQFLELRLVLTGVVSTEEQLATG